MINLKTISKLVIILSLIYIGALSRNPSQELILHLASILITGGILFFALQKLTKQNKKGQNCLISLLILALVLDYKFQPEIMGTTLFIPIFATTLTVFIKFFFQYKGSSIINPVVLAIILSTLIFPDAIASWWGTNYYYIIHSIQISIPLALILVAIWSLFFLKKWRKFPLILSFFIALAPILYISQGLDLVEFTFKDGTIYFLATIMLTDPKSSPMMKKDQIIFGLIAALAYGALLYFAVSNYALLSIAIANLYLMAIKLYRLSKTKKSSA